MKSSTKLIWIALFGVTFGLVEAAIVVYLREVYYPDGFAFPLRMASTKVLLTEVAREGSTIIMLIAVGILAGRTRLARFGAFLLAFGVWDIFYYVWLKLLLDWPASLMDWDVLYLIPVPWIAPVLAPVLVSLALIGCGAWIFWHEERGDLFRAITLDWVVEVGAGVLIIASFMVNNGMTVPERYSWWLFLLGLVSGVGYFVWRARE